MRLERKLLRVAALACRAKQLLEPPSCLVGSNQEVRAERARTLIIEARALLLQARIELDRSAAELMPTVANMRWPRR